MAKWHALATMTAWKRISAKAKMRALRRSSQKKVGCGGGESYEERLVCHIQGFKIRQSHYLGKKPPTPKKPAAPKAKPAPKPKKTPAKKAAPKTPMKSPTKPAAKVTKKAPPQPSIRKSAGTR